MASLAMVWPEERAFFVSVVTMVQTHSAFSQNIALVLNSFACNCFDNCTDTLCIRVGVISKPHVSTPKSFTFVLKSTMNTKKWHLKVNNHPLIGFLVL